MVPSVCDLLFDFAVASLLDRESDCDSVSVTDEFSVSAVESVTDIFCPFCTPALAPTFMPTAAEDYNRLADELTG